MQLNETAALAEAVAEAVTDIVTAIQQTNERIAALESSSGLTIHDSIEAAGDNPKPNSLARHRGGVWRYFVDGDGEGVWRVLAEAVEAIDAIETPTGAQFIFEMSSGKRFEQTVTFPRAPSVWEKRRRANAHRRAA